MGRRADRTGLVHADDLAPGLQLNGTVFTPPFPALEHGVGNQPDTFDTRWRRHDSRLMTVIPFPDRSDEAFLGRLQWARIIYPPTQQIAAGTRNHVRLTCGPCRNGTAKTGIDRQL